MMSKLNKERILSNLSVAIDSVASNKVRSFLTALGIIFGVAAVITMLAIGKGAEKEIMDQMELVGVNNISITPMSKQAEGDINQNAEEANSESADNTTNKNTAETRSPGLSMADADNIRLRVPGIEFVSPEIVIDAKTIRKGMWRTTQLIGISNDFFEVFNFKLEQGRVFTPLQHTKGLPVCIIGNEIKKRFFDQETPIGSTIKVNDQWLTVVGILEDRQISQSAQKQKDLGIRNYNMDIYIPLQTMLIRYENRSLVNKSMLQNTSNFSSSRRGNIHQLDKLVVKVSDEYDLNEVSQIISKILQRRHQGVIDFKITIPELLLKQQQNAKQVFSIVLAVIASISLLVGGIGIMNIMLASVLERIKEIGLRMALGARQSDIIQQFLLESIIIGISGGVIGVLLGGLFSFGIELFTGIQTIISLISVLISFGVAVSVGLLFGIMPARKASMQNPINSLRHE